MSEEFPHVGHGLALSPMLAVPSVPVEEDEVRIFRFPAFLFDPEDTLYRGVFSAHRAGILFRDPHPPLNLSCFPADGLLRPPFYRQRNSFPVQHLETFDSVSIRS